MEKFGGEKVEPIDEDFENQKKEQENKNYDLICKELAERFSEKLNEDPIILYEVFRNNSIASGSRKSLDKVNRVEFNGRTGKGGDISINFGENGSIYVGKDKCNADAFFGENYNYKFSKESMNNILDMMDKLINRSEYNDVKKSEIFKEVENFLKSKVLNQEESETIKKTKFY